MTGVPAPAGFDSGLSEQWSRWVLAHGLPAFPAELGDDESVPVAWWVGLESAAVLHLRRWPPADLRDLYEAGDSRTDVDVDVFARTDGGWALAASGGSGG